MENIVALFSSPDRQSSKLAPGKDGQKHEPEAKKEQQDANAPNPSQDREKPADENQKDGKSDGESEDDADQGSDSKTYQQSKTGKEQRQDRQSDRQSNDDQKPDESPKSDDEQQPAARDSDSKKPDQAENQVDQERKENQNQNRQQRADRNDANQHQQRRQAAESNNQSNAVQKLLQSVSKGFRWLVYLLGILAALLIAWLFRNDLAKLFKKRKRTASTDQMIPAVAPARPLPPFSRFQDPFSNGSANSMSTQQLAFYSMEALEAWGRDFNIGRDCEVTPLEYARSLKSVDAELSKYAIELADLYGRCAFSKEPVGRVDMQPLVNLWRRMTSTMIQAGSRNQVVQVN